jgi:hypothetical protein
MIRYAIPIKNVRWELSFAKLASKAIHVVFPSCQVLCVHHMLIHEMVPEVILILHKDIADRTDKAARDGFKARF